LESIDSDDPIARTGVVDYTGLKRTVKLLYLPEAKVGDYVIVQAGFATTRVEEGEAREALEYARQINEVVRTGVRPATSERLEGA
jgi:hydrogenase expression/formation protein HypC